MVAIGLCAIPCVHAIGGVVAASKVSESGPLTCEALGYGALNKRACPSVSIPPVAALCSHGRDAVK